MRVTGILARARNVGRIAIGAAIGGPALSAMPGFTLNVQQ